MRVEGVVEVGGRAGTMRKASAGKRINGKRSRETVSVMAVSRKVS